MGKAAHSDLTSVTVRARNKKRKMSPVEIVDMVKVPVSS